MRYLVGIDDWMTDATIYVESAIPGRVVYTHKRDKALAFVSEEKAIEFCHQHNLLVYEEQTPESGHTTYTSHAIFC